MPVVEHTNFSKRYHFKKQKGSFHNNCDYILIDNFMLHDNHNLANHNMFDYMTIQFGLILCKESILESHISIAVVFWNYVDFKDGCLPE